MSKTFTISGSYGTFTINDAGQVLSLIDRPEEDDSNYAEIERFDVAEYIEYNGCLDDTDILLIGYWTRDGVYEPPVHEHRKHIEKERSE